MSYKQNGGYTPDSPPGTINYSQPKSTNASGKTMKGNFGRGPTTAGQTTSKVPNTTAASGKINGGRSWDPKAGQNYKGNPDMINTGRGPTKGNMC